VSLRLLASYLALTVVVLLALEVPLAIVDARNERQDLTAKVERDAFAVSSLAEDVLQRGGRSPALLALARGYDERTNGRVVVVDRRGHAIADSRPTTPGEGAFASRPEIAAALRGRVATGIRPSHTLGTRLLYVAVPVASNGVVVGAVRITYPTATLDARVRRDRLALLGAGLLVLAAAAAVGAALARWIARPLRRLELVAAQVGAGDLEARAAEDAGPPEVRRLAAQLNRTSAQLAALLASQEQFVADASHELRTPLAALRLRLETGDVDGALREAERLGGLVDELLALARADSAGGEAEPVSLVAAAWERAEAWQPLFAERGVRLDAPADDGQVVLAGPGRLAEVLDNLLANALEASPPGGTVRLSADGASLHVVDEGPGLSAEQRERAFDRFWRASSGPGSGLGLPIARRLVEADGGSLTLREAPGGGVDAVVAFEPGHAVRTGSYSSDRWR
jgi:signal transduction histidine kinase